jgi:ABC-type microcin C transport system duplicated ATPase subunit YejF
LHEHLLAAAAPRREDRVSTTSTLLQVERVSVRYTLRGAGLLAPARTLQALSDVSIAIPEGGRLGVVGESGSGKSTLARVVLGLVRSQAGRVAWEGRTVDYDDATAMRSLRRELQVVFQDPFGSLDPRMTAGQVVGEALQALAGPVATVAAQDRIRAALSEVGLAPAFANRYPHEMSGGQCQRVAIARAIVARPRLLVCDEVVSALDVSVQAQIVNLLHELSERYQMSLLFISHNLAVVRHLCDDVAVLCQGRVVEQGSRDAIFNHPREAYTRALLAAVPEPDPVLQRARIAEAVNASRTSR